MRESKTDLFFAELFFFSVVRFSFQVWIVCFAGRAEQIFELGGRINKARNVLIRIAMQSETKKLLVDFLERTCGCT